MFYTNILFHSTSFDPRFSPVGDMALTIAYHQTLKNKDYSLDLLHTKKTFKNLSAEQPSSL